MSSEYHEENTPFEENVGVGGHEDEHVTDDPDVGAQSVQPSESIEADGPVVSSPAADALALFSDIESKMAALRDWQQDHEHQVVELTEWTARLNTRSDALAKREGVFEEHKREVEARSKDLVAREGAVVERFENLEHDRAKLDEEWARLGSERDTLAGEWEKLSGERESLAAWGSELEGREAGVEGEKESVRETIAGFDAREAELVDRAEAIDRDRAELDEKRRKVQEELDQISEEWGQIDLRRKAQDQLAETLENDRRRIDQLRHRLNEEVAERVEASGLESELEAERKAQEQAEQEAEREADREAAWEAERGAIAAAEAAAQARAQELSDQLDALRSESSETIEKLSSRVAGLEHEASERGEAVDHEAKVVADDLRRRLEELEQESDQTIDSLKARVAELEVLAEEREALAAEREAQVATSESVSEPASESVSESASELSGEGAIAGEGFPADEEGFADERALAGMAELAEREASIVERERELDRRRQEIQEKLSSAKDELAAQRKAFVAEREAFDRLRESFEREAEEAKNPEADSVAAATGTEAVAFKIGEAAETTRGGRVVTGKASALRIARLKAYRAELQRRRMILERDEATLGMMHKQYASLLEQRKVVLEVKDYLEASESVMVQRWATHRAITLVASVVMIVAAVGASSYKIAEKMAVQTWRTASVFEYVPSGTEGVRDAGEDAGVGVGEGGGGIDFNIEATRSVEKSRMLSEPVLNETLSRLQQEGLRRYADAEALREFLLSSMTLSAVSADRVRVAIVGEDPERLEAVLGSLGRAISLYHSSYVSGAGAGSGAGGSGDAGKGKDGGVKFDVEVVEVAIRDAAPVSDDTLVLAGQYFGMGMGGAFVIGLLFWVMLRRSGRVLETADSSMVGGLDDDSRWPSEARVKG